MTTYYILFSGPQSRKEVQEVSSPTSCSNYVTRPACSELYPVTTENL